MIESKGLTLHDRIKGAIFGHAVGDALGLGTEFMTRQEAQAYYPEGLREFTQIIRDCHRSQWAPGETTNDTEYFLALINAIVDNGGYDLHKCAHALKEAVIRNTKDVVPLYRALMAVNEWETSPLQVAHRMWKDRVFTEATNEAVNRGIVAGMLCRREELDDTARQLTLMTNDDTRCVATTVLLSHMAYSLLHTGKPAEYDDLAAVGYSIDSRTIPYLDMAYRGSLEDLRLDDEDNIMWTRKAMAAALWPIWHCDNPADSIYAVTEQGGDADSNACLAGALAGLRYGYDALPDIKEKLVNKDSFGLIAEKTANYVESL